MSDLEQKRICYLMAVYNDPQGMLRTLRSLLADDPLADIVIVDDGSKPPVSLPDTSTPVSMTLLHRGPNAGLAHALNHGLEHILSLPYDYIARIDAGDLVIPGRLAAQIAYMDETPHCGALGTQADAIDPATQAVLFRLSNPCTPRGVARTLPRRSALVHPSTMIRADAFRICGLYDPAYLYAEDYELWRRLSRHYDLANLPGVWIKKEITPGQMIATGRWRAQRMRLKVQLKYFNPLSVYGWIGVLRSLTSFIVSRETWLLLRTQGHRLVFKPVN